jgi:hypothetical protein
MTDAALERLVDRSMQVSDTGPALCCGPVSTSDRRAGRIALDSNLALNRLFSTLSGIDDNEASFLVEDASGNG